MAWGRSRGLTRPGLDDVSELGIKRTARTRKALEKADLVLVVCEGQSNSA